MKKKLMNNLPLKFLSLIISFVIWLTVVNIVNPVTTKRIKVTPEVINSDILKNASKYYKLLNSESVYLEVPVRSLDYSKVTSDDFRVWVNLKKIYELTSVVPVEFEIINNKEFIQGEVVPSPYSVNVEVEDVIEKEYDIETETSGELAPNYTVGKINTKQSKVRLKGPESSISDIVSAGIEINIEGKNSNIEGQAEIIFYDAKKNKKVINKDIVDVSLDKVAYTVSVLQGKSLEIKYNVGGTPAGGYRLIGVESDVKSVAVYGEGNSIDSIDSINIPADVLNVDGLS